MHDRKMAMRNQGRLPIAEVVQRGDSRVRKEAIARQTHTSILDDHNVKHESIA